MCQIKSFPVTAVPLLDATVTAKIPAGGPEAGKVKAAAHAVATTKLRTLRRKKKRVLKKTKVSRVSLTQACRGGDLATVKAHLAIETTNVNERVPQIEYTPLHYAVFYGHMDIVEVLVEHGAAMDVKTATGLSPLHIAVDQSNVAMCQTLLEGCADPSVVDDLGCTALHRAVIKGSFEVVELFLQFSVEEDYAAFINVNCISKDGTTPLITAIIRSRDDVVSALLQYGADVTKTTIAGDSPLAVATRKNNMQSIVALLDAGADPAAMDDTEMSPMDWAEERELQDVLALYREKVLGSAV
mmetsp:Transcript_7316/g.31099  ORF Transcript_7316/g.31099 Transcript_7316/m.31099 type:complete len:299 (+) Transcript_7316:153-1049(+)|eukprot:CAMPEP_0114620780 /NCGR_PEP_ID=MMETSP0168-20121206/8899_1 /TAXON_ID=95228 ORGANISM="Vannella sp., Strain DIVA3 517/6/12" /NCGR_SAMPLE_ID=MMETSP0168 /ASSEMBLY_ACC=CAM_ASM_000044 /LENGTH=298 /DNA_ID=CAMNT_0001831977 /DNA_START=139 /DNA_END=1035 /DNA_ORIENTATION=-